MESSIQLLSMVLTQANLEPVNSESLKRGGSIVMSHQVELEIIDTENEDTEYHTAVCSLTTQIDGVPKKIKDDTEVAEEKSFSLMIKFTSTFQIATEVINQFLEDEKYQKQVTMLLANRMFPAIRVHIKSNLDLIGLTNVKLPWEIDTLQTT